LPHTGAPPSELLLDDESTTPDELLEASVASPLLVALLLLVSPLPAVTPLVELGGPVNESKPPSSGLGHPVARHEIESETKPRRRTAP
jgi:hypothetical protein